MRLLKNPAVEIERAIQGKRDPWKSGQASKEKLLDSEEGEMLKTKMTETFGIQHPIMMAGMNWITEPNLVAAVCDAGALGTWPSLNLAPKM